MIRPELFYGRVVNIQDPEEKGRIQIRIHEIHADTVLDEHLPWANSMMAANSGSTSGAGQSSTGLRIGDEVVGYFRDTSMQEPVIAWTWHGDDDIHPYVTAKDDDLSNKRRDNATTVSDGSVSFTEPVTDYSLVQYPYNNVTVSRSGHVVEVDDTQGHERLAWIHKLGSYFEMQHTGDVVDKTVRDRYTLTDRDLMSFIGGKSEHKQQGHATSKYDATFYTKAKDQHSIVANNVLLKAEQTAEIRAQVLNVIAELAVSDSITVPLLKATKIQCDDLSCKGIIKGTTQFAMGAAKANRLSGSSPVPGEGAGNTQVNPKLKDTDGYN